METRTRGGAKVSEPPVMPRQQSIPVDLTSDQLGDAFELDEFLERDGDASYDHLMRISGIESDDPTSKFNFDEAFGSGYNLGSNATSPSAQSLRRSASSSAERSHASRSSRGSERQHQRYAGADRRHAYGASSRVREDGLPEIPDPKPVPYEKLSASDGLPVAGEPREDARLAFGVARGASFAMSEEKLVVETLPPEELPEAPPALYQSDSGNSDNSGQIMSMSEGEASHRQRALQAAAFNSYYGGGRQDDAPPQVDQSSPPVTAAASSSTSGVSARDDQHRPDNHNRRQQQHRQNATTATERVALPAGQPPQQQQQQQGTAPRAPMTRRRGGALGDGETRPPSNVADAYPPPPPPPERGFYRVRGNVTASDAQQRSATAPPPPDTSAVSMLLGELEKNQQKQLAAATASSSDGRRPEQMPASDPQQSDAAGSSKKSTSTTAVTTRSAARRQNQVPSQLPTEGTQQRTRGRATYVAPPVTLTSTTPQPRATTPFRASYEQQQQRRQQAIPGTAGGQTFRGSQGLWTGGGGGGGGGEATNQEISSAEDEEVAKASANEVATGTISPRGGSSSPPVGTSSGDGAPVQAKPERQPRSKRGTTTPAMRRLERNQREQRRSNQISQQIDGLRQVLSDAGIAVKASKASILTGTAQYIRVLQAKQVQLESERQRMLAEMRSLEHAAAMHRQQMMIQPQHGDAGVAVVKREPGSTEDVPMSTLQRPSAAAGAIVPREQEEVLLREREAALVGVDASAAAPATTFAAAAAEVPEAPTAADEARSDGASMEVTEQAKSGRVREDLKDPVRVAASGSEKDPRVEIISPREEDLPEPSTSQKDPSLGQPESKVEGEHVTTKRRRSPTPSAQGADEDMKSKIQTTENTQDVSGPSCRGHRRQSSGSLFVEPTAMVENASRADDAATYDRGVDDQVYEHAFSNSSVPLAVVALDGSFIRVNQKFIEVCGYARDELAERTIFNLTSPTQLHVAFSYVSLVLRGIDPASHLVVYAVTREGKPAPYAIAVSVVAHDSGPRYFSTSLVPLSSVPPALASDSGGDQESN
ncbi:hypothetical protein CTAYLR_001820 [Chrysophaeum taylorii]|uniref:BHLH domain-containing protein n=1 Tax=Chrysophaeum taylorii TaxID=2483200 RepID=A0AAD7U869_9STRA|nr:hypothetical protein CTAYLR_001820 [Chrysophaeum taylorii]